MLIAHNELGNRVSIDRVNQGEKYFCPICGHGLTVKARGKIRKPHFAHSIGSDCDWGDMSEWHASWQEKFPEENREIIIEKNAVKHRADVFIPNARTVIEFQHSQISAEDFNARNLFYTDCGYKLVWIFDATNRIRTFYDDEKLDTLTFDYESDTWHLMWKRKKLTFKDYELHNKGRSISILLDVESNAGEKSLYIAKAIDEKKIDVYAFCEPIKEQNFLRTYGIIKDTKILSLKQISEKTNRIIESGKRIKDKQERQKLVNRILNMGVGLYFYNTRGFDDR